MLNLILLSAKYKWYSKFSISFLSSLKSIPEVSNKKLVTSSTTSFTLSFIFILLSANFVLGAFLPINGIVKNMVSFSFKTILNIFSNKALSFNPKVYSSEHLITSNLLSIFSNLYPFRFLKIDMIIYLSTSLKTCSVM